MIRYDFGFRFWYGWTFLSFFSLLHLWGKNFKWRLSCFLQWLVFILYLKFRKSCFWSGIFSWSFLSLLFSSTLILLWRWKIWHLFLLHGKKRIIFLHSVRGSLAIPRAGYLAHKLVGNFYCILDSSSACFLWDSFFDKFKTSFFSNNCS